MPDSECIKKLSVSSLPDDFECVITAWRKKRISANCRAVGFGTPVHVSECFRFMADIFQFFDFHPLTSCTNQRHCSSEHTYFLLLPPFIRFHSFERLRCTTRAKSLIALVASFPVHQRTSCVNWYLETSSTNNDELNDAPPVAPTGPSNYQL